MATLPPVLAEHLESVEGVRERSYEDGSCIETSSGNKVSRQSVLCGTSNIRLHGKAIVHKGVIIRGDLATVRLGRYCVIDENSVIRPPFQMRKGNYSFIPLTIGDNVFIGKVQRGGGGEDEKKVVAGEQRDKRSVRTQKRMSDPTVFGEASAFRTQAAGARIKYRHSVGITKGGLLIVQYASVDSTASTR